MNFCYFINYYNNYIFLRKYNNVKLASVFNSGKFLKMHLKKKNGISILEEFYQGLNYLY